MNIDDLKRHNVDGGGSISEVLDDLARHQREPRAGTFRDRLADGAAFVTFAYDIDGVSMEIAKYAQCLERISPGIPIHCIGGNFADKADAVLEPHWQRHALPNADGWDKWDDGRWFARLFYENLPEGSAASSELAREMWHQALALAEPLVAYIQDHHIGLVVNVNTNSNPGNVAFALAVVLATEVTDCAVINNNHDFYWEGGKAACKRNPGEEPGPRDHFFRNHDNPEFFAFFQRIFPWNGRRWVQANINPLQSRRLIDRFHFRPDVVFTIGTLLDEEFFRDYDDEDKREYRRRMSHVLGGRDVIEPTAVADFRRSLDSWMLDQRPVVCAAHDDLVLDITANEALYVLQPTRIVPRKRIWCDWELIGALLHHPPFRVEFERRPELTLTLHVTGPVPIEHRDAVDRVLQAYEAVLDEVPSAVGRRLFQAFSVGWQTAPSMSETLGIVDIYQLADLVVFPSMTEGRGLPIPESAAALVPLVCAEYEPRAVFEAVVGMDLPAQESIIYDEFTPDRYDDELLDDLTAVLLDPASQTDRTRHNREAVRHRYSRDALTATFATILERLEQAEEGR
jgi:glycosyltransferase involved in cell wall biosynthesis